MTINASEYALDYAQFPYSNEDDNGGHPFRRRAHLISDFLGNSDGQADISRGTRRQVMQALRKSCEVMGPGQKSRIGRLGGGAAIGALIAGFATPAMAQYSAGGGSATGANSVAIGAGATATHIGGVATGTGNTATGNNAVAVGSSNNVNSFDAAGAVITNQILDRAVGGTYTFPVGGTGVVATAVGVGSGNSVAAGGIAVGTSNQVNGVGVTAVAVGLGNSSTGGFGVTMGVGNRSSATAAIAIGTANTASGNTAIAAGRQSTASGQTSIALGNVASATQTNAIALGHSTQATASGAIAIGGGNNSASTNLDATAANASAANAIALGTNTTATLASATAIGNSSDATGENATALGAQASAVTGNDIAIGFRATSSGGSSQAIGADAVASGSGSTALGNLANSSGIASAALGNNARAAGNNASAIGFNSSASGNSSFAVGPFSSSAGIGSIAIGTAATASLANDTAVGISSTASGGNSFAGGRLARATGASAIAIGNGSTASGTQSIAIGTGNNVSGINSGAFGDPNVVTGNGSYAFGNNNTINADNAFAIGNNITIAAGRDGSVGIGNATTVNAPNTGLFTLNGGTAAATAPTAVVSVGAAGAERQITNVAAGVLSPTSTNAINGSQLFTTATAVNNLSTTVESVIGNGINIAADGSLTVPPTFLVAGSSYNNVAAALGALDTANTTANNGLASALGGGTTVAANGTVTAPAYTIGSTTYNNVGDALQAVSGGFSLTTAAAGSGTVTGTTVESIAAGETVTVTAGDNIEVTQTGNDIEVALKPALTGITSLAVTGGPSLSGTGIDMGGDKITNLAAGSTALGSTDAVNGGQLNTGLGSVATNLGGGSTYDPVTGTVTAPAYNLSGNTYNNVGDALAAIDGGTVGLVQQIGGAPGTGDLTVGAATGGTVVDVTGTDGERRLTGILPGSLTATSTDAVNGAQVNTLGTSIAANTGGGSTFDPVTGTVTAPAYTVAGGNQTNAGAAFDALDDANTLSNTGISSAIGGGMAIAANGTVTAPTVNVNGTTYNNLTDAIEAAGGGFDLTTAAVGTGIANGTTVEAIGAGETVTLTAGDNIVTTQVGNETQVALNPVLTGITSLAVTGGPTLSGTGIDMGGDKITNLAAGNTTAGSTEAVNGGQINTGLGSVATNLGGGSTYDPVTGIVTAPAYNLSGNTYNNVGDALAAIDGGTVGLVQQIGGAPGTGNLTVGAATGGTVVDVTGTDGERRLTGILPGSLTATSTDAVNGAQVNTLGTSIAANTGGGSTFDPVTGTVTAPSYTVAGGTQTNAGAAFDALDDANMLSNTGISSAIGGGMAIAANGTVTAPTVNVNGTTYNNLTDAIEAAGDGFDLTTAAIGTGVANGTTVEAIGAGETVTLTAGDNIVTTQVGNETQVALNPALTGITSLAVTGGPTLSGTGIDMGGDKITNLAAGSTALGSTDAINGGQLNTGLGSVATNLGGGSTYDPVTGIVTAPGYAIDGTTFNNVGDALAALAQDSKYVDFNSTLAAADASGTNASAIGPNAQAAGNNAVSLGANSNAAGNNSIAIGGTTSAAATNAAALGSGSSAQGTNSLALGSGAVATGTNSVALGSGSQAGVNNAGWTGTSFAGQTMTNNVSANGVVSVSGGGTNRQITGVADGAVNATSTDAISGSQLFNTATALDTKATNIGAGLASSLGGGASVAPNGTVTNPTINAAGSTYNNVTDAIQGLNTANNTTNAGLAAAIGGGAAVAPNGAVTAPTVPVNGTNYGNLTDAISAAGAGFNFTTAAIGTGVANGTSVASIGAGETQTLTASDNVITTQVGNEVQVALNPELTGITSLAVTGGPTLSGTGIDMGGGKIINLAAGSTASGSTEAVNGGQLNTGLGSVATNLGGGSVYDPITGAVTAPTYTIQGNTYNNVGNALGAVDSNLNNILNGTAGLIQQVGGAPGAGQITVGSATGGTSVSFAGTSGNRILTDVAPGAVTAVSDDAVNGSQIFANNQQVAGLLGGSAGVDPTTGALTAPSYTVGSNTLGNVGAAIAALQTGAPVQYSTSGAPTTPNGLVPSQNMTLVGAAAGSVTLSNVGPAALTATSTDAVNGTQINALASSIAANTGGGSAFDPLTGTLTAPTINAAGATFGNTTAAIEALNAANIAANTGLANAIGGGASVGPDGAVTAPIIPVNGTTYNNLTDAIAAAGAGYNLTTAATGTGVANSASVAGIGAGETVTLTAGNNIVTTQVGNEVQVALASDLTGLNSVTASTMNSDTVNVTDGPSISGTGINMNGDKITGLAAGATTAGSTEAVNGGQINTGLGSVATNLGGGSTYNPVTGTVTAPIYAVQGSTYNTVGDAFGGVDTALTNLTNGTSGLVQQVGGAPGAGQISVGAATGGASVSFAGTGGNRVLTDIAVGAITAASDDAVNGSQIFANNQQVSGLLGGGAGVDPTTGELTAPSYTVGANNVGNVGAAIAALQTGAPVQYSTSGAKTTPNGLVPSQNMTLVGAAAGPVTLSNVAPATLTPASTDAVNGAQINTALGSVAAGMGGGSTFDPITGTVTAPAYTVAGGNQNNVGAALDAIDSKAGNVGAGLAAALGGGASIAPDGSVAGPVFTVNGSAYGNVAAALGGVSVNLASLNNAVTGGAGIKYFHANSTKTDSAPVGTDSIAVGPVSGAAGDRSISIGLNANAAGTQSIAIGTGNNVTGNNSGALGDPNIVSGNESYALGNNNTVAANNAFAIGNNITIAAGQDGSVGIGSETTVAAPNTGAKSINGGVIAATAPTSVVSVGAAGAERQVTNVAAGVVSATSTDAINGSQLFAVGSALNKANTGIAGALGGGAAIAPDGTVTAPSYNVAGGAQTNVGAALTALDGAVAGLANGTSGLVQQVGAAPGAGQITVGAATGGTSVSLAGTAGSRVVRGVADGLVAAGSNEAVNGGQLSAVQQAALATSAALGNSVAAGLGGGAAYNPATGAVSAPSYSVGGKSYGNTGAALAATNLLAVQYVADANGAPTNTVRLTGNGNGQPVAMTNVAAGAVTAMSTDAVNGGQLFGVQQTANGALQRSGGALTGSLALGGNRITGVGSPVDANDAATKGYIDAIQSQNGAQLAALTGGLNSAFKRIERNSQGVALAIALGGGYLSDDKNFSLHSAWGSFDGYNALAAQSYIRLTDDVVVNGGISFGLEENLVGTRLGIGIQF